MQKQLLKKLPTTLSLSALAGAVLFASQGAVAAGLTLNEQSASGMGTAYAGRSSSALDASTVFGNPAGMSRLDRMQVSGGLAFIDPHIKIKDGQISDAQALSPAPNLVPDAAAEAALNQYLNQRGGTNKGNMTPFTTIPFGYFVKPINEQWHVGFGVYAPLGGKSKFEDTFSGRYQAQKTEVTMITFQPTISYKFNDMLSVGIGPTISYLEGTLSSRSVPVTAILPPGPPFNGGGGDKLYTAKGDDVAVGANMGVLFQPYENTTFGLTYRTHTKFKLSGDSTLMDVDTGVRDGKSSAKLDFTAPENIELSFTHKFDDQWTLYAGTVWTRWSRLDEIAITDSIEINNPLGAPVQGVSPKEEVNFKDTWSYAIGGSYQVNPEWILRAGFALDSTPNSDSTRSVRTPFAERKVVTLGAGWSPTQNLTIDAAYGYLWESDAPVDAANKNYSTTPGEANLTYRPGWKGTFKNKAHGVSGQVTYRF